VIHGLKCRNISFEAEVVEVLERKGRHLAKIRIHSLFLEVDADSLCAHLGDILFFQTGPGTNSPPENIRKRARR
jgi:hypothetical protein